MARVQVIDDEELSLDMIQAEFNPEELAEDEEDMFNALEYQES